MEDATIAVAYAGHHPPGVTLTRYTDGMIYLVADAGLLLEVEAARELRRQLVAVAAGPYVVVTDLRKVSFIDREARTVFAGNAAGMALATGVIVGREGPMQLLVDRWLADNEVRRPVRVFETPEPAIVWGHKVVAELRSSGHLE